MGCLSQVGRRRVGSHRGWRRFLGNRAENWDHHEQQQQIPGFGVGGVGGVGVEGGGRRGQAPPSAGG